VKLYALSPRLENHTEIQITETNITENNQTEMATEVVSEERMQMLMAAAGDPNSAWYKGVMTILRDCEATDRRAKMVQKNITIPFELGSGDLVALEEQFSVGIRKRGVQNRARLTGRVAAVVHIIDAMLLEHAAGGGRRVLAVDYDLASFASQGLQGLLVERSNATARLQVGYVMEDSYVRAHGANKRKKAFAAFLALGAELTEGGGEHYHPYLREDGPQVDSIVVNHFKTPVGLEQVAWFSRCRGGVVYGCFPFQVEMLTCESGDLAAFPGRFYVDKVSDTITLVPTEDASMSISHPYSLLMSFVDNNSVTIGQEEFVCEKYLTVKGILFYTVRALVADFEAPEVLRSSYYDASRAARTVLRYPKANLSDTGVPVGWGRGEVTILTSRFERVLSRVMTSRNAIVTPDEVMIALIDNNNKVVNTLDTASTGERMPVESEFEAALAIALHVNYRRHMMRGTFNVALDAVRKRFAVGDKTLMSVLMLGLGAWWRGGPRVVDGGVVEDLLWTRIVDWMGNDFSVVAAGVDAWVDVEQTVGALGTGVSLR